MSETSLQRPGALSPKAAGTRRRMIECAEAVILEEGIERLSMDRVAARTGMSKGAVMYHFHTKRDLLAALVESYAEHLESRLSEAERLLGGPSDVSFIPGYVAWYRGFDRNNRGWSDIGLSLLALKTCDPELLEPVRAWYRKTFARVAAMPPERRGATLLAMMALEGFFYTHKFGLDLMAPDEKAKVLELISCL